MTKFELSQMSDTQLQDEAIRAGCGRAIGKTDREGMIEAILEAHNGPQVRKRPPIIMGGPDGSGT